MNDWLLQPEQIAAMGAAEARRLVGGKAASLANLTAWRDAAVPEWFVITPALPHGALGDAGRARLAAARSQDEAAATLASLAIGDEATGAIRAAIGILCNGNGRGPLAVRSSGIDEDGACHSFAGQFESYLNVEPEQVLSRLVGVWASGWSERVQTYRRRAGLPHTGHCPAVIVQRMAPARYAGVCFGADPVTGDPRTAVVAAVAGLGEALVSGAADAETLGVDAAGRVSRRESGARARIGIPDSVVAHIARLTRRLGERFGTPQDVEWAVDAEGTISLLQSRPITVRTPSVGEPGELRLWDNSNIAESYGGITLPLTFSFARRAYEEVYRSFCRLMSVPESRVRAGDAVFRNMLGLVRGRVYYNLLNWYRLLAMLPGYRLNRRFMEQMMGVREPLAPELDALVQPARPAGKLRDAADLAGAVAGLVLAHARLRRMRTDFLARLETALAGGATRLESMTPDRLAAHYRELESALLTRWDAPIVNDFFAMIHHGLLRRACAAWVEPGFDNDLVGGVGGIISSEPAERIRAMADLARGDLTLARVLAEGATADAEHAVRRLPALAAAYDEYLERFADRCLEELKLESPTTRDDPATLLRSIGRMALAPPAPASQTDGAAHQRRLVLDRVRSRLRWRPVRRVIIGLLARRAAARVRDRENLRFERTRVFGRVRRIFLHLGRHLADRRVIDTSGDVFYLEAEEVLGFVEGTSTTTDLRELVRLRREQYRGFAAAPAPPDRFATRGPVHLAKPAAAPSPSGEREHAAELRRGLGCGGGLVRGTARIIRDPRIETLTPGEILVAERTDPGWVAIFPAAAGIIVQRGSLLSHSAIVAREMGIAAVVSVPGLLDWLATGDLVELDGGTGVVRRIGPGPAEAPHD